MRRLRSVRDCDLHRISHVSDYGKSVTVAAHYTPVGRHNYPTPPAISFLKDSPTFIAFYLLFAQPCRPLVEEAFSINDFPGSEWLCRFCSASVMLLQSFHNLVGVSGIESFCYKTFQNICGCYKESRIHSLIWQIKNIRRSS